MFSVLTLEGAGNASPIIESMFRLRHEVFVSRLGWKLEGPPGMEIDQFDTEDAVYLALPNRNGDVVASARLLPMNGPTLLKDVFSFLIENTEVPSTPDIWEVTRVAVDHRKERIEAVKGCDNVAGALFCGIFEFAYTLGLSHLVSVSDPPMERILRRCGWTTQRLGNVHRIDDIAAVGEISEVSLQALMTMRQKNGIAGPVLKQPITLPASWNLPERRAA